MAVGEIFLSAFIQVVFQKLVSPEAIEFARREGVHTAIDKWKKMMTTIMDVLDDAEEKQITKGAIKTWLEELQDLAYDVDDMLDEFATETLRRKLDLGSNKSKVRSLIPSCCTNFSLSAFALKSRIRSKITEINGRFVDICERKSKLGLEKVAGETSAKVWQKPTSTSLVDESRVYGRDEDKEKIIKLILLKDEANNDKFCVIAIVGMGGVGKTTLAQLVYNNKRVQQHFDFKAWVCVSYDFDVKRIMETILGSISPTTSVSEDDLNQVQIKLKDALSGKKFLVVLDDVWNKKPTDWDALWIPFRAGAHESRVIVTTRDREVALRMVTDQNHCHYLNQLSDDECWSVFEHYAFENRKIVEHQNLELIGREIMKKCKGLPLAVRTLGGLLRSKVEENEWKNILNSKIWDLPVGDSDILPALRLSYLHLPSHLKRCFTYFSVLPMDYEFGEKQMVLLWMAEGFLQQQGEKQMEDLGHDYFRDLLYRSFFQQSSSDKSLFVMHDLINDLAQWVAGETSFRLENNLEDKRRGKMPKRARHSSYVCGQYDGIKKFEAFDKVECLRTFLPLKMLCMPNNSYSYLTNYVPLVLLLKLRFLTVLSLNGYRITELPNKIGDLKHLRYLDLSCTWIRSLPKTISTLYNLQTLLLTNCSSLWELPVEMRKLRNLRHLDITGVDLLKEMPLGLGILTSLQTLSNFVVGKGSGSTIRELRNLIHLRGTLHISGLENVIDARDAREASLNDKQYLDVLEMKWSSQFDGSRNESVVEKVLDTLHPHKKLKELTIKCYGGTTLSTWIGNPSFSHMVLLRLIGCVKCTSLPPLGQLPLLKDLCIERMNGVNRVGPEFNGKGCPKPFPSLETLSFEDMEEWEDWFSSRVEGQVEVFPCLGQLSIKKCPKLSGKLPDHLPSLEKLRIRECQQLAVSISSLPKLCKLDIQGCQEVVHRSTDSLCSLKSMVLNDISKLTCLTGCLPGLTKVEDLEMNGCRELTSLLQNEAELLQNLRCLKIKACPKFVSLVAEEEEERQQHRLPCILESLELFDCSNLEKLQFLNSLTSLSDLAISGCSRLVSFPKTGFPSKLRKLFIGNCDSVTSVARGQLPSTLKVLEIRNCKNLLSLLDEEESSISTSSSASSSLMMHKSNNSGASLLEDLSIWDCTSLTSLSSRGELSPTLKSLSIYFCTKLESLAERLLHNNTSLESISISGCESLKSLPEGLHNLTPLSSISIEKCPSLVSFPDGGLLAANLRHLSIIECEKLEALPHHMHNLTSLETLSIFDCPGIVSFPEEGFPTNLTFLWIEDVKICKPLFEWGLDRFTSLRQLGIGCLDLVSFPEEEKGMILPSSLTYLCIHEFQNLEYLSSKGFQNLTSLEELQISNCPKLKSFPEEGLPPSLLRLWIEDCPLLKLRCKKDQGRDWPKIADIPEIWIDHKFIYDQEEEE